MGSILFKGWNYVDNFDDDHEDKYERAISGENDEHRIRMRW